MSIACTSMDYAKSSMNPSSLESIPEPVTLSSSLGEDEDEDDYYNNENYYDTNNTSSAWQRSRIINNSKSTTEPTVTRRVWPIMVASHQLQQQADDNMNNNRVGKLDLYSVEVPNMLSNINKAMVLKFGAPQTIVDSSKTPTHSSNSLYHNYYDAASTATSRSQYSSNYTAINPAGGILDGAWLHVSENNMWWYATAHSTGEIYVHSCQVSNENSIDTTTSISAPVAAPSSFDYGGLNIANSFDSYESAYSHETWYSNTQTSMGGGGDNNNNSRNDLNYPFQVRCIGKSERQSTSLLSSHDENNSNYHSSKPPPLCLSVNWDSCSSAMVGSNNNNNQTRKMVSSYSNGRIAIHNVSYSSKTNSIQLYEADSWQAHTMFTCPSEAWSACFASSENEASSSSNFILSGGDEGFVKFWDIRCTTRPMQILQPFDAGVTVISPHPRKEYIVACGSYDETMNLMDVRYVPFMKSQITHRNRKSHNPRNKPQHVRRRGATLSRSGPLGGGIWRIKWHPYDDGRILVAAMHGGCRIVQVDGIAGAANNNSFDNISSSASSSDELGMGGSSNDSTTSGAFLSLGGEETDPICVMSAVKEFNDHESMVYGADWLTCKHPTRMGFFEAAASCSFYDQAVHIWDTVM